MYIDPHPPDILSMPECYHDLREIFSKAKATSLPPQRPYDCAIDLLLNTSPLRGDSTPSQLPRHRQ